ncbi:subtilisin-like protein [Leucosporidium creatinivorum]|uniref:tripeptidyl-peptidase II n=1 Tax=Leucosporidium creatinivorum TaxID=106004 RepID=A0A1Y2FN69_9BASI|nr:subtilisin-like protein [Leucosporidium creatinivorum]
MKLLLPLLLAPLALAAPLSIFERRDAPPSTWSLSPRAPHPETILPLRIGLAQSNIHQLEASLLAVSDPESEHYGKHWSAEKVADFFAPAEEAVAGVRDWLAEHGLKETVKLSKSRNWLMVDVTVEQAEKLLATKYETYEHVSGSKRLACSSYSIPSHLREHIEIVTPTLHFDQPDGRPSPSHYKRSTTSSSTNPVKSSAVPGVARKLGSPSSGTIPKVSSSGFRNSFLNVLHELQDCAKVTTLDCLRVMYNFALYKPVSTSKNSLGIVEYTPQAYVPSDLDFFFANYSPSAVGSRPTLYAIDGGVVQQTDMGFGTNGESNLDLQYAMGLVHPQPVGLYQVGDEIQGASFNNLLDALDGAYCTYQAGDDPTQDGIYPNSENCGVAPLSNVISTSYGYNEADLTPAYEERQCNEYAKLGLMGVTLVFSSGDYGVAGNSNECINPADGSYTTTKAGTVFNPAFPSSCPYITSVGATQLPEGGSVLSREQACETVIYSGGGFSNVFPMPSYQKSAVASYFKNHKPSYSSSQYNNSMKTRGFPDVAANGANYNVAIGGAFGLVFGTSASAPTFASIITLINDARLAIGKKPVGFINPTIYSSLFKAGFHDIVSGGNQGCGTPGFSAVSGWDPVTGLGTPNFGVLLPLWLALP